MKNLNILSFYLPPFVLAFDEHQKLSSKGFEASCDINDVVTIYAGNFFQVGRRILFQRKAAAIQD